MLVDSGALGINYQQLNVLHLVLPHPASPTTSSSCTGATGTAGWPATRGWRRPVRQGIRATRLSGRKAVCLVSWPH